MNVKAPVYRPDQPERFVSARIAWAAVIAVMCTMASTLAELAHRVGDWSALVGFERARVVLRS